MKPPCQDAPPPPFAGSANARGVVYVERSSRGNWEDQQRSRSIPHSGALLFGALSTAVLWLSIPALIVCLTLKLLGHPGPWGEGAVASLIILVLSLAVSLGLSLTKKCPLCHGTPLHSRPCPKHRLANRWPLLTYRATTVLCMLTTLSFRCMYCGTPFRLFKKSSRLR